ncbi:MAG: hypothetical protein Q9209_003197 [Squamulea sp. 1 TL-2023]
MAVKKKRRKPLLLSHTRPPSVTRTPSLSSRATRSLIRKHHTLRKQLQHASINGDSVLVEDIQAQLQASGGLQKYQEASIQGQSLHRGGDSSKVLMGWINEALSPDQLYDTLESGKFRMLEVGALKVDNACSRSGFFDVTRIDLHSQHPDIQTQDFMQMPVPSLETLEKDGFDIISLSLVVNYVGDAISRGDMLKRVGSFLRDGRQSFQEKAKYWFPALFLVLPAPCVTNSRYFDEERLESIMVSLGYIKTRRKLGKKLIYYLWHYKGTSNGKVSFRKQEIRSGGNRNNFTIIMHDELRYPISNK